MAIFQQEFSITRLRSAIILGSLGIGFLGFALPVYGKKLGLTAVQIGGLVSIYSIGTLLIRPGLGWALDKFGRKKFLLTSLLLFSLSMLAFAFSEGMVGIYAARILQAVGGAVFWISAYTIAIDVSDGTDKGQKVGIIDESFARGTLIGGMAGFSLLGFSSQDSVWTILFILYAVLGLLGCWEVWTNIPETKPDTLMEKTSEAGFMWNRILSIPVFVILLNTIAVSTISMTFSPVPMLLLQDHYTDDIGMLGAVYIPISIICSLLPSKVGKISDRLGRTLPICGGLIITGLCSLFIALANNYFVLILLWAMETLGICLLSPAQAVLLTDKTDSPANTGSTYGLFTFITSLSRIIGPLWGSWLYSQYGPHAFAVSGCILLGVAILAFLGLRVSKVYTTPA